MINFQFKPLLPALLLIITYNVYHTSADENYNQKTTYIVHMDHTTMPESFDDHSQWYTSSLSSVSDSPNILYTYSQVIHGYSATLSAEEATSLKRQPGVLSVLEETRYELLTTRTPQFLGLDPRNPLLIGTNTTSNIIIGILDTGVWPESKSYDDTGFTPVPSTWKGTCETGTNFKSSSCNKKLIGARYFSKGYEAAHGKIDPKKESKSARDDNGHGTHTSTTAAGSPVPKVSLYGYASGTARGMAPHARLAAYKVCWVNGCVSSDILAGMDMAVQDGVNIMSVSIGAGQDDYYKDSMAIGAFGAMSKGVLVVGAAGNSGPSNIFLSNVAPWITTVGASTIDRDFPVNIRLGNGKKFTGVSLYSGEPLPNALVPIVYAKDVTNNTDEGNYCITDSLIPSKVAGKIVICDRGDNDRTLKGLVVKNAGGIGMIIANIDTNSDRIADSHIIPAASVDVPTGDAIKGYVSSVSHPTATISSPYTQLGVEPAPVVAGFSCRGPNNLTPAILKPDLIAPGVEILAAWSGEVSPSELAEDTRRVSYNIISGTSMACPHVSGIATLIKGAHPDWSPAAVRSALMTTANITDKNGEPIKDASTGQAANAFDYGAGHINSAAAFNPGLVYDTTLEDYLNFLCALNYTSAQIQTVAKQSYTCDVAKNYSSGDLNYPSFAVTLTTSNLGPGQRFTVKYTRTLTNVGTPGTYKASLTLETPEVKIKVHPETLTFKKINEKKSYTVTFTALSTPDFPFKYARLVWSDGKHLVASPIGFNWD